MEYTAKQQKSLDRTNKMYDLLLDRYYQGNDSSFALVDAVKYGAAQYVYAYLNKNISYTKDGLDASDVNGERWKFSVLQAKKGNWIGMVVNLLSDGQSFFESGDEEAKQIGKGAINLARLVLIATK